MEKTNLKRHKESISQKRNKLLAITIGIFLILACVKFSGIEKIIPLFISKFIILLVGISFIYIGIANLITKKYNIAILPLASFLDPTGDAGWFDISGNDNTSVLSKKSVKDIKKIKPAGTVLISFIFILLGIAVIYFGLR